MIKRDKIKVITSTNEKNLYKSFWPSMAQNWKQWYGVDEVICAYITEREEDDPQVVEMRKYGRVVLYKPDKEIEDSIQAKITRLYHATLLADEYCVIGDIDMYILNKEETWQKWFSKARSNKLLCVSNNAPYSGSDVGKFPMAFTVGKGRTWKEIVNPAGLEYEDLIKSWYNLRIHDSKEAVNQNFSNFSDESLLRALISKWENYNNKTAYEHPRCIGIERDDWNNSWIAGRRVDRANWPSKIDVEKLQKGDYYDSQPLRPFDKIKLKPILEYLNIK